MKRMIFNARQPEEMRVAVIKNKSLQDLLLEQGGRNQKKANIYKAKVTRIEPSLEAAFVNYGQERHGFLPIKEVAPELYQSDTSEGRPSIKNALKEGQEILIQVDKEERGSKGAALSTFISLAGSYLVLMPNNPRAGGVSRRIEGEHRNELKEKLAQLSMPSDMGVIIRTAGVGRSLEELQWDLDYLVKLWTAIKEAGDKAEPPSLIYQESDAAFRALRDYLRSDINEIVVDTKPLYEKICNHMKWLHPDFVDHIKLYTGDTPVFTHHQVESQIESVYQREIRLKSGGSIVIDRTEALVAVDINSSKATKGGDIEETALNTNLEAADEIARQLRLRDLGGLVVVDFIDMSPARHQRQVEERLQEALSHDRARIQTGRISRFGLLELSRQRLRASVGDETQELCPRCHGRGTVRGIESLAVTVMRLIEDKAVKEDTAQIYAQVPVEVGTYLLNEKRVELARLESEHDILIFVIPNPTMKTPRYDVTRSKAGKGKKVSSYKLAVEKEEKMAKPSSYRIQEDEEEPAVKDLTPDSKAPKARAAKKESNGLVNTIVGLLFGTKAEEKKPETNRRNTRSNSNNRRTSQNRRGGNNNQRRRNTSNNNRRNAQQRSQQRNEEQQPKQQRRTATAQEKPVEQTATKQQQAKDNNEQGTRNNNRRGGGSQNRRRGRGGNRRRQDNRASNKNEATTNNSQQAEQTKTVARPAPVEKAPAAAKPVEPKPAPVAAEPKPKRAPRKPTENTDNYAQVETTHKAEPAAYQPPKKKGPTRPRRADRPKAQAAPEQLEMVETGKSDNQ